MKKITKSVPLVLISMALVSIAYISCTKEPLQRVEGNIQESFSESGSANNESSLPEGGIAKIMYVPGGDTVHYVSIGNKNIFEGDMDVTKEQLELLSLDNGNKANYIGARLWTNKTMPYVISTKILRRHPKMRRDILAAMRHITQRTGFRFVRARSQKNYVYFDVTSALICTASVGTRDGRSYITLSKYCRPADIIHELGHALGLKHEHNRRDRDRYITIHKNNIMPRYLFAFRKTRRLSPREIRKYRNVNGRFDFRSIMMYSSYIFATRTGPSITKKNGQIIPRTRILSAGDVAAIKRLYKLR